MMIDRRRLLLSGIAMLAAKDIRANEQPSAVTIGFGGLGREISPTLFGSNELGTMRSPVPSVDGDRYAGARIRRLGGNMMTSYNWVNNAINSGLDWKHESSFVLADFLGIPEAERSRPAAVIDHMHRNSLGIGAKSIVTLPLAGYVAADGDGPVDIADTAPSSRFVPVTWNSTAKATDPVDASQADIPQLLRKLVSTYGGAGSAQGIYGYILDNEPGLWSETHPRIVPERVTIASLLERSIHAAKVIKSIDPDAKVFGPASWGVTGYQTLQFAPDWSDFARFGSFIAAYLAAFQKASEDAGTRLLDVLDVHWYPQSALGDLIDAEDEKFAEIMLAAPRSLTEKGYRENSWITDALPVSDETELALPIVPSLSRLIDRWYPGTDLAVTEYNFGGPNALYAGLATADALGRMATAGVRYSGYWGHLQGWIAEAFRLYTAPDGQGGGFSGRAVETLFDRPEIAGVHAVWDGTHFHVVLVNKANGETEFQFPSSARIDRVSGFDEKTPYCRPLPIENANTLTAPGRSARIVRLTL